jgi:hypothetical protein
MGNLLLLFFSHVSFLIISFIFSSQGVAVQLVGRAVLDAATFAPGPTSGQQAFNSDDVFVDQQPVQGFSAVLPGPTPGTFLVMVDNGFGSKSNSADFVLRVYGVEPDFTTGQVFPVNFHTGERLSSFSDESFLQLNDRANKVGFPIIAEQSLYPNTNIFVDSAIQSNRWLTGADFDIESFRRASDGSYWFGDEFGPFLLHVSANGQVMEAPISLPNFLALGNNPLIQSLNNPLLGDATSNSRGGLEGLALNTSGTKLYAMLENELRTEIEQKRLLINEFDLETRQYTGQTFSYKLEDKGRAIGEITAINDDEFLVIERDNKQGTEAELKQIYKIDLRRLDSNGFVEKKLLVDLLNIPDPNGLGGIGTSEGIFTFPFFTIESVLPIDEKTLLVINDNNYPFLRYAQGRSSEEPDNTELIFVQLDQPLNLQNSAESVPESSTLLASIVAFSSGVWLKAKSSR